MEPDRVAGGAGVVAAAAVFLLVVAPYAVLDLTAVGPYYAAGPAATPILATFPLLTVVVLAAGLVGRQPPPTMAGAALVLGAVTAVLAWWWALAVPPSLVGSLTDLAILAYHRWALAAAATALLGAAAAYARDVV